MTPGRVGIGEALALRAVVVEVALPVRVGRKVGAVEGHIAPVLGKFGAQGSGYTVEAGGERFRVFAQLDREAVAGPLRGRPPDGLSERVMLRDQARRAVQVGRA